MISVTLTAHEMYLSGLVGYRRNLESIVHGRTPRFPEKTTGELFGFHIIAAMAECAVAKGLGIYWGHHINKFESADVGRYEVRYSKRKDLKIRERDKGIVVSVTGYPPTFKIVGWIDATDAKKDHEPSCPRQGPPAYFIPHDELYDMARLRQITGECK